MATRENVITSAWLLLPWTFLSVGLGYFASSRRRAKHTCTTDKGENHGESKAAPEPRGALKGESPHPGWTPGQKQPPPTGLDAGGS